MTSIRLTRNSLKIGLLFAVSLAVITFNKNSLVAQITTIKDTAEDSSDQVAGITSLMSAVSSNDIEGINFFIKGGTDIINQVNIGGATALHIAARENNFEAAKILVENGADVNIADNEGWTPLMRAALANSPEIVTLLLDNKADANSLNSEGDSVIIQAANSDCTQCINVLFEKFNFAKLMDLKILQSQLNSAFVIARNRENQLSVDAISAYQDRIVKVANLLEPKSDDLPEAIASEKQGGTVEYNVTTSDSSKKFKLVVGDNNGEKTVKSVSSDPVISLKKSEDVSITQGNNSNKKYALTKETPSSEAVIDLSKKEEPSSTQAITKKKFTFVKASEDSKITKVLDKVFSAKTEKPTEVKAETKTEEKVATEEVAFPNATTAKKKFVFKSSK